MYTDKNYQTKKALIADFKAGKHITVYQPNAGMFSNQDTTDGSICLEGPHYPQPHKWYASATIKDSVIVRVR